MHRLSHISAIVTVASALSAPLWAQSVSFGVRGGLDIVEMHYSGEALNPTNRAGFFVGPVLKVATPVAGLSVDVAALFDQRDIKVDDHAMKQKSLLVPAHARLGVSLLNMVGVYLCAGPQFSFNVGSSTFYWENLSGYRHNFTLQETTLSLNLGGGAHVGRHLEASVFYNIPMGKTADFTWDTIYEHLQDQTMHRARSTTNAWRIALAYYF